MCSGRSGIVVVLVLVVVLGFWISRTSMRIDEQDLFHPQLLLYNPPRKRYLLASTIQFAGSYPGCPRFRIPSHFCFRCSLGSGELAMLTVWLTGVGNWRNSSGQRRLPVTATHPLSAGYSDDCPQ